MIFYKLQGKKPVQIDDVVEWALFFEETENRIVRQDYISPEIWVSTVFLGIDHSFLPGSDPILFETLVFGGPLDGTMDRYQTWSEAEAGHKDIIRKVKESLLS